MSDKSRRRKAGDSGDSEKLSEDSYDDNDIIKGSEEDGELNASTDVARESEYETVEDSESDDSNALREEDDDEDDVIIEYEREEGDGQESVPPKEKKLDDDEDRRNPQYIPKRGTFYEHDDRTATEEVSGGETNEKEAADRSAKEGQGTAESKAKKVWREHENRWSHDRFNPDEQAPKSREELIAIYGYDIRNEEGPPRARRRRRYGRGPNKYTRNWEDEEAYGKPQVSAPATRGARRGGRRGGSNQGRHSEEQFPPLVDTKEDSENNITPVEHNLPIQGVTYSNRTMGGRKQKEEYNNTKKSQQETFPPLESEPHQTNSANNESSIRTQNNSNNNNFNNKEESSGISSAAPGKKIIHRDNRDAPFTDAGIRNFRGRGRGRGRGGSGGVISVDMISSNPPKARGGFRSSSGTTFPSESVQQVHHNSNVESLPPQHQQQQHSNASPNYQISKISLDEAPREYHRRNSKVSVHSQQHIQQPQLQTQQIQSGVSGSERRQQTVVPPRMQHQQQQHQQDNSGSNRPKRYSSLRQRTLPESGAAYTQAPPTTAYYQPAGELETSDSGSNRPKRYSTIRPTAVYTQPDPASTYYQPTGYVTQQPVYGDTPQHPQSAGTPPLQLLPPHPHAPPPAYAAPFPSPTTTFVGPPAPRILPPGAGAPPTYIPAPAPVTPIINYVATPPTYTAFQGFTTVPAPGPPPPTELYQPQGGITYYNTEEQTIVPRPITQKRQRSAIPIVPPPEKAPKGRGRTNREEQSPPGDIGGGGDASSVLLAHSITPSPPPPVSAFEDLTISEDAAYPRAPTPIENSVKGTIPSPTSAPPTPPPSTPPPPTATEVA